MIGSRHVQTAKPEAYNALCILRTRWNFRVLGLLHSYSRRMDRMQSLRRVFYGWKRLCSNIVTPSRIVLHQRIVHGRIRRLRRLYRRVVRVFLLRLRRIFLKRFLSTRTGLYAVFFDPNHRVDIMYTDDRPIDINISNQCLLQSMLHQAHPAISDLSMAQPRTINFIPRACQVCMATLTRRS